MGFVAVRFVTLTLTLSHQGRGDFPASRLLLSH